jgi:sugar lactone lactonase YvrE
VAHEQGLYVVDIPYGRILWISEDKKVEVCGRWDGEPNGLAATADGKLLVADYKQVSREISLLYFFTYHYLGHHVFRS